MTYSRGHGLCDYPKSSVSTCPNDASRLLFRYQACADIGKSVSATEDVRCMAKWKEGSTHYFLGEDITIGIYKWRGGGLKPFIPPT